jgi:hypothetical protein
MGGRRSESELLVLDMGEGGQRVSCWYWTWGEGGQRVNY